MIIKGLIEQWKSSYDEIAIDGDVLGHDWDWEDFVGKVIHLRYFISDQELIDLEHAEEVLIKTLFGACDAKAYGLHGSEWTGQYGFEQELVIGGHDLLEELRSHVGKYVLIEVRVEE